MTVIPLSYGKGEYDVVKQVLCVLCLCLVSKSGSYLIIGKPFAFKMVIAVTVTVGLSLLTPSIRLDMAGL